MYISMGLYQPKLEEFPPSFDGQQFRQFQYTWYAQFPWLEYSKEMDATYCFACFLFYEKKKNILSLQLEGLRVGRELIVERDAMLKWGGLKNPSQHTDRVMNAQSSQQILQNILQLQTSIKAVKWLAKQACAFKSHDESIKFFNPRNFIEIIKYSARMNKDIAEVVLENAPGNAKYTSSDIQKELLNIIGNRMCLIYGFFFSTLNSIVNVFGSSPKRHSELKSIREVEIIDLIASRDLETGTGANQICSLQRLGATLWSFPQQYLEKLICNGSNNDIRGEAKGVYDAMSTFKFVFILHFMNKVLWISDLLCQPLQMKSQDFLNAIHLISATKSLLQNLRENVNGIKNEFLSDCMVIYIKRGFVDTIDSDSIIDEFNS
ncbi:hypothetical protein CICLE_v10003816mg [Citrus x clementina]|uniref:TTF-type domain-containing protein n=1 Tax=Citrus clementina TaxID=85681 RepID=V4T7H1_CITCL|nr:hypothetical protein CICLE_v10003816mg [Citrus x clementina]